MQREGSWRVCSGSFDDDLPIKQCDTPKPLSRCCIFRYLVWVVATPSNIFPSNFVRERAGVTANANGKCPNCEHNVEFPDAKSNLTQKAVGGCITTRTVWPFTCVVEGKTKSLCALD